MQCYHRIASRVDSGYECTYSESVILQTVKVTGVIGNGSLQYFFESNLDVDETAEALRAIGESEGAELILEAKALFPDGVPIEDWDERLDFMQKESEAFDRIGQKIVNLEDRIDDKLAAYALENGLM